jgi:hypothetical protein
MRLQVRGVDHDPLRLAALLGQRGEDLVEHAQPAPADEAVVDRLVRAILLGRVAPTKSPFDDEHDGADNPTVVHPCDAVREREIALDPTHLRLRKQKQISHGEASSPRL